MYSLSKNLKTPKHPKTLNAQIKNICFQKKHSECIPMVFWKWCVKYKSNPKKSYSDITTHKKFKPKLQAPEFLKQF